MRKRDTKNRPTCEQYARAQSFLNMLKRSPTLTLQQRLELRRRAIHGDIDGAYKEWRSLTVVDGGDLRNGR